MKLRFLIPLLIFVSLLSGCAKKQEPPPAPQGPFDYAELAALNDADPVLFGAPYSVPDSSQKATFKKAYRCETFIAGSELYLDAVVLEIDSQDMEATQAVFANRWTSYLVNQMNIPYQVPADYVLLHDPIDEYMYLVFETKAKAFSPDFRYFVLGDFTPTDKGAKNLIFDTGELLEYADISPISATQELPDEETLDQLKYAIFEKVDNPSCNVGIGIVEKKVAVLFQLENPGSKELMIDVSKQLYLDCKEVFYESTVKMDQFSVTFTDESGEHEYGVHQNTYEDPYRFLFMNLKDEQYEYVEVFERPESSSSNSPDITLAEYNKIKEGDSYIRVKKIVGGPGELLWSDTIMDSTFEVYVWYGADGISNAQIYFDNGAMYSKAQFGLS